MPTSAQESEQKSIRDNINSLNEEFLQVNLSQDATNNKEKLDCQFSTAAKLDLKISELSDANSLESKQAKTLSTQLERIKTQIISAQLKNDEILKSAATAAPIPTKTISINLERTPTPAQNATAGAPPLIDIDDVIKKLTAQGYHNLEKDSTKISIKSPTDQPLNFSIAPTTSGCEMKIPAVMNDQELTAYAQLILDAAQAMGAKAINIDPSETKILNKLKDLIAAKPTLTSLLINGNPATPAPVVAAPAPASAPVAAAAALVAAAPVAPIMAAPAASPVAAAVVAAVAPATSPVAAAAVVTAAVTPQAAAPAPQRTFASPPTPPPLPPMGSNPAVTPQAAIAKATSKPL